MKKVISLSLFGYENKHDQSYSYEQFMQFFSVGLRAYRVLFPDWKIFLFLDINAYNAYSNYFDSLKELNYIDYELKTPTLWGNNSLWRIEATKFADYTICRDIDALPTYRERQAVDVWLRNDTLSHIMTDSVSHSHQMMAGMCGFKKGVINLENLQNSHFSTKGSDQDFLLNDVYPNLAHSITEHKILGLRTNSSNPYSYNYIENIDIQDINLSLEQKIETNKLVVHMGQSGFDINSVLEFYDKYGDTTFNKNVLEIEKNYKNIFQYLIK